MKRGTLFLESGEVYQGAWRGGQPRAGEVVFNTSHSGYEEIATDPSYFSQIMVMTAPQQGNYGVSDEVWESRKIWIDGFICVEMQDSARDRAWRERLDRYQVPIISELDTRKLVMHLRSSGTVWGALIDSTDPKAVREKALELIKKKKAIDPDWTFLVSRDKPEELEGALASGPRLAIIDFGTKENIVREARARASAVKIFPARAAAADIKSWKPDGIILSNGPGDPAAVKAGVQTVRELLGWRYMFGICMGHQVLALALGAKTYKLKFGHRGSNHPIRDEVLKKVYISSQNHGYAVDEKSLPADSVVTHINLNDHTVAGLRSAEKKFLSVQFHPESHPGPHDAVELFDYFVRQLK